MNYFDDRKHYEKRNFDKVEHRLFHEVFSTGTREYHQYDQNGER